MIDIGKLSDSLIKSQSENKKLRDALQALLAYGCLNEYETIEFGRNECRYCNSSIANDKLIHDATCDFKIAENLLAKSLEGWT